MILEIPRAVGMPTSFKDVEYIRVGSYKKKLKDFPEKERKLWLSFERRPFELRVAMEHVSSAKVTELLDCAGYYTVMNLPLPSNREAMLHNMMDEQFIQEMDNGSYQIMNIGALLFAKDLRQFPHLARKAIRVIRYKGQKRTSAIREKVFTKGYALQFEDVTDYVMSLIPQGEVIDGGRREEYTMFPRKAIREMLGNIMIHQDLTTRGAVSFLRIARICEERGSGFDRMEEGMSDLLIPAFKVESAEEFTRIKLNWYASLNEWSKAEKIRTCYIATCYNYVNEVSVSNTILRERFGVEEKNKAIISRIIRDTLTEGLIKLEDENATPKMRRYIPYWA